MSSPEAGKMQIPPLSWECGYADLPGGRVCKVQLTQAQHAYLLHLPADDMERLGQALVATARQARSGLVVAAAIPPTNGSPPRG